MLTRIIVFVILLFLPLFAQTVSPDIEWYRRESDHFILIYKPTHAHLADQLIQSAESALSRLMVLFDYHPSEKIYINTYDFSDYGAAGTTTVPQNFIRLQIEPLELGYENIPFNNRFQWLLNHELIHIVVNDKATRLEAGARKIFSKVPPEYSQPITIPFSLLGNYSRYTPRWHQEGIAVYMETWLSGGYGRILGNFDEMFFRSVFYEGKNLPTPHFLEAHTSYNSFLLEMLFYLYGGRFCAYLSVNYGSDKLLEWFTPRAGDIYPSYTGKFKRVFGKNFDEVWQAFTRSEILFQQENLDRLKKTPFSEVEPLSGAAAGWVTPAYPDTTGRYLIWGAHRPHHLTTVVRFDLQTGHRQKIGSIPSPSMIQIGSTAYDPQLELFFYTTNNNRLYRDLHVMNTRTRKSKLLFRDCRVGQITVSPVTHELWGIEHRQGQTILVYSPYPYRRLIPVVNFGVNDNLQHLAISSSGRYLATTLHQASGRQAVILANLFALRKGENFSFLTISDEGSPEHPAWSPDESYIFWNAYTNGVSNIYRYNLKTGETVPLSHTPRGLFHPLYLDEKSLFAFEFTSDGFLPVRIPNRPVEYLPAIKYYGQQVIERNPEVKEWVVNSGRGGNPSVLPDRLSRYRGSGNLHVQSIIPVVSGFQTQRLAGIFTHIADPLYIHDLTVETGVTPLRQNHLQPRFHLRAKYEYKRRYRLGVEHNAPDFSDLFNQRKRGMIGNRFTLGHTKFWVYDTPHKVKQTSEIAVYTGIEAINDNLVVVTHPDFVVLQSVLQSTNVRRSIGSVDFESGKQWQVTGMFFGVNPQDLQTVGGFHAEGDLFSILKIPHNTLHLKLAAGWRHTRDGLAIGKFYFGGFGNRYLENAEFHQYRKVFRFPGLPIYSLPTSRFLKGMLEHNLPPWRPGNAVLGQHYLAHIDFSWYSQALLINSIGDRFYADLGAQLNFTFKHWFNLETAMSFGVARAWSAHTTGNEWFISLRLLKK